MHITPWSDRLTLDIALMLEGSGETMQEVITRHGLQSSDILSFSKDPVFNERVVRYREDVKKNGLTFKLKARAQAEELLNTSWLLIHSPDTSPAVKADLIKSTVKWAGLEPKNQDGDQGGGGGVSITINLGNEAVPMRVIEHQGVENDA